MDNQTSGHCANSMGVRGHSAGTIFPAVIMIQGNPFEEDGLRYHVLNHPAIDKAIGWRKCKTAISIAAFRERVAL